MIGSIKQSGNTITIYNEKGNNVGNFGISTGDQVQGYTSTTVSIKKKSGTIQMYNEKGQSLGSLPR